MPTNLLDVQNLHISFRGEDRRVDAVKGVDFHVEAGETVAIVGESGSGKSVTAMSLTRLLPAPPTCDVSGSIHFGGQDVLALSNPELRHLRGGQIAYIFQEPSASLNPVFSIGHQIAETIRLHQPGTKDVRGSVVAALEAVGIRDAAKRARSYPHELSGGMQQRVMIAMALACQPRLLVADEPTTALDVTIQKQVMTLLADIRQRTGMAIILITHNFGIVKGFADRVLVMYQGEIVEHGPVETILKEAKHPYTRALIGCIPRLGHKQERLATIDAEALV